MDGVQRAVTDDSSSSLSLASSELRVDVLSLIAAAGIPAKQLLKTVSDGSDISFIIYACR